MKQPGGQFSINQRIAAKRKMFHVKHVASAAVRLLLIAGGALAVWASNQPPVVAQTPPPAGCEELVRNGSFETLGSSAWSVLPDPRVPEYVASPTFEGSYALQLGIVDLGNVASSSRVQQTLTLPAWADSVTLRFRYFPLYDNSPGGGDLQYAYVFNEFTDQIVDTPLRVIRNDRDWLYVERNLTEQAGQQIRLVFAVDNDGADGRTAMYLDSVSVLACSLDQPVPTATSTGVPPVTATPTPSFTPTPPIIVIEPSATPIVIVVTATPTISLEPPTATPPPPPGCRNDTGDGGFESDSPNWIFGRDPVPPRYVADPAGSGSRVVLLGNPSELGNANVVTYSSVRRLVTIPSDATSAIVSWRALYRTEEGVDAQPSRFNDRQDFVLLSPGLDTIAVPFRTRSNTSSYEIASVDLSGYRGRTLYLYFNAFNDGNGGRTWMYLDDVSLEICGAAVSVAQPAPVLATPAVVDPPVVTAGAVVIISATETAEALIAQGLAAQTQAAQTQAAQTQAAQALPLAAPSATPTLEFPALPTVDAAALLTQGVGLVPAEEQPDTQAGGTNAGLGISPNLPLVNAPLTLPLQISLTTDLETVLATPAPESDSFVPFGSDTAEGTPTGGGLGSRLTGGFGQSSGSPWGAIVILLGVLALIFLVGSLVQNIFSGR